MNQTFNKPWSLKWLLPQVRITARLFWVIISCTTYGPLSQIIMMTFEQLVLMALSTRIAWSNDFLIDDKTLYENLIAKVMSGNMISVSAVIITFYIAAIFCIIYLYRQYNKRATKSYIKPTSEMVIVSKALAYLFGAFNEIVGLVTQLMIAIAIFSYRSESDTFSWSNAIHLTFLAIIQLLLIIVCFIERTFVQLQFKNHFLVASRINDGLFDYLQPLFTVIVIFLTCKKGERTILERIGFLTLIAVLSIFRLNRKTQGKGVYFNHTLKNADFCLQVLSTSLYLGELLLYIATSNKQQHFYDLLLVWFFISSFMGGILMIKCRNYNKQLMQKFMDGIEKFQKNESRSAEYGLYLIEEYMDSMDPCIHRVFQTFMINSEMNTLEYSDHISYMQIINKILKVTDLVDEEEEDYIRIQTGRTLKAGDDLKDFDFQKSGEQTQKSTCSLEAAGTIIVSDNESVQKAKTNFFSKIKLKTNVIRQMKTRMEHSLTMVRDEPIGSSDLLMDFFKNDHATMNVNANLNQIQNPFEEAMLMCQMGNADVSSEQEAIKLVKIRFLYEMISKRLSLQFPKSLRLMFYRATLALNRLHNKYLTITTLTHINIQSKRSESYISQIEMKISENYFYEMCEGAGSSNKLYQTKDEGIQMWSDNEKLIDINALMLQSLQVDNILSKVKLSCQMIAQFWSLFSSEQLSTQQFNLFQELTGKISDSLEDVRNHSNSVESMESIHNKSESLCLILSQFYTTVLRDHRQGSKIASRIEQFAMFANSNMFQKENSIEEVGVIVTNGNFDLYGKILFGNKSILKALDFKIEDIAGKLIHTLMPRVIADHHNQFWKAFATVGEPKVLDKVRFLFVRNSKGFITPLKLFIKFQYNPNFGYSFVGIFKKPKELVFTSIDKPIPVVESYQLICNKKGEILEISQSCKDLLKLTPENLELLHAQLQENLQIQILNREELNFKDFDFSNNSCIYFKNISLDFTELFALIKNAEVNESNDADDTSVDEKQSFNSFSSLSTCHFRAQLKITREDYGVGILEQPIGIYYVLFSEASMLEDMTTITLQPGKMGSPFYARNNTTSNDAIQNKEESPFLSHESQNIGCGPKRVESLVPGQKLMQIPEDQQSFNTASQCSSKSSQTSNQEDAIKVIDESIDDLKTPRILLVLRLAITLIVILMTVLSLVQYVMNSSIKEQASVYQNIMLDSNQSQERIYSLMLLTRMYQNINSGLEPKSAEYVTSRIEVIKQISLELIVQLREKLQQLKHFLSIKSDFETAKQDFLLENLLMNNTVEIRKLPSLYAVNLWLVKLEEIMSYNEFSSNIGTYLYNKNSPNTFDQMSFFVTQNGMQDISSFFSEMISYENSRIASQIQKGLLLNQIFTMLSGIFILTSMIMIVFLILRILSYRLQVFDFFNNLTSEQINMMTENAEAFYDYVKTDDSLRLVKAQREMMLMNIKRNLQNSMLRTRGPIESGKKKKENEKKLKKVEKAYKKEIKKKMEREKEEIKKTIQKSDESETEDEEEKTEKRRIELQKRRASQIDQIEPEIFEKQQKDVLRYLQLENKRFTWKITPYTTIISVVLILYFVIQYLLFEKQSSTIQSNTYSLNLLIDSLECQDFLIYKIRIIESSNNTRYMTSNQKVSKMMYPLKIEQRDELHETQLNITYLQCLQINQKAMEWLQTYQNGQNYITGKENNTMCDLMDEKVKLDSRLTKQACQNIYKGALQMSQLQSTSLFLKDAMLSLIKYNAEDHITPTILNENYISYPAYIDLLDGHTFFSQTILRSFYRDLIAIVLSTQDSKTSITIIFGVFLAFVLAGALLAQFPLFSRIRRQFWNTFLLLQLLPRDDLDREVIKSINNLFLKA